MTENLVAENQEAENLVLPVPGQLAAMYLVPASMPGAAAQRVARQAIARRVAEPLRSLARSLLGTPALAVAVRPLAAFKSLPAEDLGEPAADVVAFATMASPRPGPVHEWLTRAASAAFAAELGLPVVDGFARQVLSAGEALATLPGSPLLTHVGGGFRLADWVAVRQAGHCLTTCGLGRFGLPELRLDDVPPELHPAWTIALTGLGGRLLELLRRELRRGGETAFVQVPDQIEISRVDVGAAYGLDLTQDAEVLPVRLSLDPAITDELESYLTVRTTPFGQPVTRPTTVASTAAFQGFSGTAR